MSIFLSRFVISSTFVFYVVAMPVTVFAAEGIQTLNKTCQSVKNSLSASGTVLLSYPSKNDPSLIIYDIFVKNAALCGANQVAKNSSVRTSDNENCSVVFCANPETNTKPTVAPVIDVIIVDEEPTEEPDDEDEDDDNAT